MVLPTFVVSPVNQPLNYDQLVSCASTAGHVSSSVATFDAEPTAVRHVSGHTRPAKITSMNGGVFSPGGSRGTQPMKLKVSSGKTS